MAASPVGTGSGRKQSRVSARRGSTEKTYTETDGVSRWKKAPMRSLWLLAAAIGAAVLIFAHASLVGVVIGVAFLGLSVLLLLRPVGRTALRS
jgi:hypothetical protein